MINHIKIILLYFVTLILGLMVPKKKNLIILASNKGKYFNGNSKGLFDYLCKNPKYEVYFFISDYSKYIELKEQNNRIKYQYNLQSFFFFLRAKTICISHGLNDIPGYAPSPWQTWLYLGHGVGTKSLGYLKPRTPFIEKITLFTLRYMKFFTTSDFDKYMLASEYIANPQNIFVTGYPRNDILFTKPGRTGYQNILFVPSYTSKQPTDIAQFFGNDNKELKKFLRKNNLKLFIRFHPNNCKSSRNLANEYFDDELIFDISPDKLDDVQDFLPQTDILITDFSSISRDFLFVNKPIIFFINDWENLKDTFLPIREEFAFCGHRVQSSDQLISAISDIIAGNDPYKSTREFVRLLTYNYIDDKSSERIAAYIDQWNNL